MRAAGQVRGIRLENGVFSPANLPTIQAKEANLRHNGKRRFWPGGGTPPPDAQHPAKSGVNPQGDACIPLEMARILLGRKHTIFP